MTGKEPFGFTARYVDGDRETGWQVYLPHQCDEWEIAGGCWAVSREEAIGDLQDFITEAQSLLAQLRTAPESTETYLTVSESVTPATQED